MAEAISQAPPQPQPQPEPETPADKLLREEGGDIIPRELQPEKLDFSKIKPVLEQQSPEAMLRAPIPKPRILDLSPVAQPERLPPGMTAPPAKSARQIAFEENLKDVVNLEVNILNICYGAVHELVTRRAAMEPPDSAELGQSLFGPGQRTPIEQSEPAMAVEVYRQVRLTMREEDQQQPGLLARTLRALLAPILR